MTDTTYLVGYGTLLLKASLGSSIGRGSASTKQFRPVELHDYRRLFNIRPSHYGSSHKLPTGASESAAMNIEHAPGCSVNAIAFRTTLEELEALDQREACYERQMVPLHTFEDGDLLGEGFAYVGRQPWITNDPAKLMPLWRDVVWGRSGAYQVSESFGVCFDESTYLADGRTLVVDVYGELLADTSDVDLPT
jgi:hypothetical protein